MRGGGEEEHLGVALGLFFPERRGFGQHQIAHDHPRQRAHGLALERGVRAADGGVLSHDEQAFETAVRHYEPVAHVGMVAGEAWDPPEPEVVRGGGAVAVKGLQQAYEIAIDVRPPSALRAIACHV